LEELVRLSFYCFAAATMALVASAVCYLAYAIGRIRLRQTALVTNVGPALVTHEARLEPPSLSIGLTCCSSTWKCRK